MSNEHKEQIIEQHLNNIRWNRGVIKVSISKIEKLNKKIEAEERTINKANDKIRESHLALNKFGIDPEDELNPFSKSERKS